MYILSKTAFTNIQILLFLFLFSLSIWMHFDVFSWFEWEDNKVMGNYLKTLQGIDTSRQDFVNFLENISLSKLMEYFGLFQAISETYSIDVEEFGELFKTLDVDT